MRTAVVIVSLVVLLGAAVLWAKSRVVPTYHVLVADIPKVLDQLSGAVATPAFAVFMFNTPNQPNSDDAINIQFSLENGRPGFDWVLLGPRNIKDEERFMLFARSEGFVPKPQKMNNVRYIRVESGDIAALCRDVIVKLYGLPKSGPVDLIVEGFAWTP